jgi:hypothetical protein
MDEVDIAILVGEIVQNPAPVLLSDTCAVFDVARAGARPKNYSLTDLEDEHAAVELMLELASQEPAGAWLVLPPPVLTEWRDNREEVVKDIDRWLKGVIEDVERWNFASQLSKLDSEFESDDGIKAVLKNDWLQRSKRIVMQSSRLAQISDCILRAMQRNLEKIAPGSRGKAPKDCTIFEHTLELAGALRESGFSEPIVFLSSNRRDYCEGRKRRPRILEDLGANDAEFAMSWREASHKLGLAG